MYGSKSTLLLKNLKCLINKNSALLKDRDPVEDLTPNVTAVTSAKHSDSDSETACFVRLSNLYIQ